MYDGARTPASPGRPYALESSGSVKARSNGGPSAPRSREIRRCMQTAHTYGVRAYNGLPTMHGTEFGQHIHMTFTPRHAVRRATVHPPLDYGPTTWWLLCPSHALCDIAYQPISDSLVLFTPSVPQIMRCKISLVSRHQTRCTCGILCAVLT